MFVPVIFTQQIATLTCQLGEGWWSAALIDLYNNTSLSIEWSTLIGREAPDRALIGRELYTIFSMP